MTFSSNFDIIKINTVTQTRKATVGGYCSCRRSWLFSGLRIALQLQVEKSGQVDNNSFLNAEANKDKNIYRKLQKLKSGSRAIGEKYGQVIWDTPDGEPVMISSKPGEKPESISRYNNFLGSDMSLQDDYTLDAEQTIIGLGESSEEYKKQLDKIFSSTPLNQNLEALDQTANQLKNNKPQNRTDYERTINEFHKTQIEADKIRREKKDKIALERNGDRFTDYLLKPKYNEAKRNKYVWIDFNFISKREGEQWLKGYTLPSNGFPNSGVTVGTGINLGSVDI